MRRVVGSMIVVFFAAAPLAGQERPTLREITDYYVVKYSASYGVDPDLVRAIIEVESDYNPKAVSPKKAKGLMQLMPGTQKRFGVAEPFSISENLRGGVAYLKYLDGLFAGKTAYVVAAYYSGENYVARSGGKVSDDVFRYVKKVARSYKKYTLRRDGRREAWRRRLMRPVLGAGRSQQGFRWERRRW